VPDLVDFALAADSHARQFLSALYPDRALSSSDLKRGLHTSDSQVSGVGGTLLAAGLVVQRRAGRVAIWELAPRGRVLHPDDEHRSRRAGNGEGTSGKHRATLTVTGWSKNTTLSFRRARDRGSRRVLL
jgi:hypothetical protein